MAMTEQPTSQAGDMQLLMTEGCRLRLWVDLATARVPLTV